MIFYPSGQIAQAAWQILAPFIRRSSFWNTEDSWVPNLVDSKDSSEGRGFILRWLQALGRLLPRGSNNRLPQPNHPPPFFWN